MIDFDATDERAAAIGEYVLGTLSAADREQFAARLGHDPSLQAGVYQWQDRLLGLTTRVAPVVPPSQLWARIESALDARTPRAPRVPTRDIARPEAAWWQRLRVWQGLSVAGAAAALLFAVLLFTRIGIPEAPGPRYVAVLQSPDSRATGYVVELAANRNLRLVPVGPAVAVPAGRSLQFWTKPEGAAGPTSLGLVRPGEVVELPVSRLPAVGAQQLFEVTLEPEGGSPLDRPTGPILFVGTTVAL